MPNILCVCVDLITKTKNETYNIEGVCATAKSFTRRQIGLDIRFRKKSVCVCKCVYKHVVLCKVFKN